MLEKHDFEKIRKQLTAFEEKREETIQLAREVIAVSKQIIYGVHRNDLGNAEKALIKIKNLVKKIDPVRDYETGMGVVALQEFVEAVCFFEIVKKKRIPNADECGVPVQAYLMGLCDLTGELGRKAVHDAIKKDYSSVMLMRDVIEEIYGEFLMIDLRNGELRKKSDAIKWNLNKVEDMIFSIKLKE